jgi:hypothetical protein
MQELNIKRWLDSEAYTKQKEVIRNEGNALKQVNGYALPRLAAPSQLHPVERSVFEKSATEKGQLITLKKKLPKTRGHKFQTIMKESF